MMKSLVWSFLNYWTHKDMNVYIVVDMELKGLIREALIKMILGFDIALEIEEE